MPTNRRQFLKTIPAAAGISVLGVGTSTASIDYRKIDVTEVANNHYDSDDGEGKIDYSMVIDSHHVEKLYGNSATIERDSRRNTTNIWGTVHGSTQSFKMKESAHITYFTAEGFVYAYHQNQWPTIQLHADPPGETDVDWQLEVKDQNNTNHPGQKYKAQTSGEFEEDGDLESGDGKDYGGGISGTVSSGDLDLYEMTGNFDFIDIRPADNWVIFDRFEL